MKLRVGEFSVPGEKEFVLGEKGRRVVIHPWSPARGLRNDSSVAVTVGDLDKRGKPEGDTDYYDIAIVPRDEFVEGLLAVFPELRRANGFEEIFAAFDKVPYA